MRDHNSTLCYSNIQSGSNMTGTNCDLFTISPGHIWTTLYILSVTTPLYAIRIYKVVQIWPGQTVTCLHTISPGHIWTTLYILSVSNCMRDHNSTLCYSNTVAQHTLATNRMAWVQLQAHNFQYFSTPPHWEEPLFSALVELQKKWA
jgi:hypothetical protein